MRYLKSVGAPSAVLKKNRRQFLKGVGVSLTLPLFETFTMPAWGFCNTTQAPRFMAIYLPNGVLLDDWFSFFPGTGATPGLKTKNWQTQAAQGVKQTSIVQAGAAWAPALAIQNFSQLGLKSKLSLYNHLSNHGQQMVDVQNIPNNDRPYDGAEHPPASSGFLSCTGCRTKGALNAISMDQLIANYYQSQNPVHSMHLGSAIRNYYPDGTIQLHSENISWASSTVAPARYVSPQLAFQQYFNVSQSTSAAAIAKKISVLDFVKADAQSLNAKLSATDRQRLDQYLTSVRQVELHLQESGSSLGCALPTTAYPNYNIGTSLTNYDRAAHMDMMMEIMLLAAQCNLTNVMTYMVDYERSEFNYRIGTKTYEHHSSQHTSDEGVAGIANLLMQPCAKFVKKLDGIIDLNGKTALDNSVVMIGAGLMGRFRAEEAVDYTHSRTALPLVFAGSGGGVLKTNQHVALPAYTKLSNCYQTLMDRVFCLPANDFASSDGILPEMLA